MGTDKEDINHEKHERGRFHKKRFEMRDANLFEQGLTRLQEHITGAVTIHFLVKQFFKNNQLAILILDNCWYKKVICSGQINEI